MHIDLGAGQRLQGPKGIVDTMLDPDFFASVGLYTAKGVLRDDLGVSLASVARMTYNFFQKLLVDEILLLMYFNEMPPNRFFALLGDFEMQIGTRQWMAKLWSPVPVATAEGAEASRLGFGGRSMCWASSDKCRAQMGTRLMQCANRALPGLKP